MRKVILLFNFSFFLLQCSGQLIWQNVDSLYQPLPSSVHVYKTTSLLDGKPNIAYYLIADLKDKSLDFTVDTSKDRRLTPKQFFEKNANPLVVVNTTFFSFETNRSLNVVIKDGKLIEPNHKKARIDSLRSFYPSLSAFGIDKKRNPDIAWIQSDTITFKVLASQKPPTYMKTARTNRSTGQTTTSLDDKYSKWKMQSAVGGGPVLVQNGNIKITNEEERQFAGKAINDKHPRTAMGYTANNKLIILVIQGRFPGIAEGATLGQEAQIFKDLGCVEALNLDGGGSSCLLINGKETIKVSDAAGQRPVPAVFLIRRK